MAVAHPAVLQGGSSGLGLRPFGRGLLGRRENALMTRQLEARSPYMLVQEVSRAFGVSPPQSVDDQPVLGVNDPASVPPQKLREGAAIMLCRIPEPLDHDEELVHPRGLVACQMELPVKTQEGFRILRSRHFGHQLIQS